MLTIITGRFTPSFLFSHIPVTNSLYYETITDDRMIMMNNMKFFAVQNRGSHEGVD